MFLHLLCLCVFKYTATTEIITCEHTSSAHYAFSTFLASAADRLRPDLAGDRALCRGRALARPPHADRGATATLARSVTGRQTFRTPPIIRAMQRAVGINQDRLVRAPGFHQIGSASCRERVCQYV